MSNSDKKIFPSNISEKETVDTGLAVVLIFLLLCYIFNNVLYAALAIPLLLLSMVYPKIYYYPAALWLSFSKLLGIISSKIILSIIFVAIVIPMGFIRKTFGYDALLLSQFKKNKKSVFITRNHLYTSKDLEKPY